MRVCVWIGHAPDNAKIKPAPHLKHTSRHPTSGERGDEGRGRLAPGAGAPARAVEAPAVLPGAWCVCLMMLYGCVCWCLGLVCVFKIAWIGEAPPSMPIYPSTHKFDRATSRCSPRSAASCCKGGSTRSSSTSRRSAWRSRWVPVVFFLDD